MYFLKVLLNLYLPFITKLEPLLRADSENSGDLREPGKTCPLDLNEIDNGFFLPFCCCYSYLN
ncbi:hypothetical protein Hdeb2414_s0005g00168761 [Helianthus debilis subsp. tardiflorus]